MKTDTPETIAAPPLAAPPCSRFGRNRPEVEAKRLANLRIANSRPRSEETKQKLKAALKAKWASGTRKPTPKTAHKKAGWSIKLGYELGTRKDDPQAVRERALKALKNVSREAQCKANKRLGELARGRPMPVITKAGKMGRGFKSPKHWKAVDWWFRRHDGVEIKGRNLNHLVRENVELFNPKDVVWIKHRCRATRGLRRLVEGQTNGPTVWKGWIAVIFEPNKP